MLCLFKVVVRGRGEEAVRTTAISQAGLAFILSNF